MLYKNEQFLKREKLLTSNFEFFCFSGCENGRTADVNVQQKILTPLLRMILPLIFVEVRVCSATLFCFSLNFEHCSLPYFRCNFEHCPLSYLHSQHVFIRHQLIKLSELRYIDYHLYICLSFK